MNTFFKKFYGAVLWLEVESNRRKLYKFLAVIAPLFVVAGLVTNNEVAKWLEIASSVLLFSGSSIAVKNTNRAKLLVVARGVSK